MKTEKSKHDENGRRWGGRLKFTMAEWIASTALLVAAIGATIAVASSSTLALVPAITYAITLGMAYMVYRHFLNVRPHETETKEVAERGAAFQMEVHPLLETGWEDELSLDSPEWVDLPGTAYFKVVGSRGICPKGLTQGDYLKVAANGAIAPHLCPEAEAVLNMAAKDDDSEVREWCCPVYDHLLVFKRLDRFS